MIKINYYNCETNQPGTGTVACAVPDGVPTGVITTPKNWELDLATESFNTAYINSQIKAKTFVPYLNSIDYEAADEAKEVFTSSTKVKLKTVNGKPGFKFHFSKGYHFHTAAFAANSFDNVDALLVYDNGVVFGARTVDGLKLKAHTVGMFDTENFMHKKGGDPQKTIIELQLTEPFEYNNLGVLLDPTSNGFNMKTVRGIVDTNIEMVSNATVTVVVKVTAAANGALGIKSLDEDDFKAIGTTETISTAVYNTTLDDGTYTLTFSLTVAAEFTAKTLTLTLWDAVDSTSVVTVGNIHYQGNSFYNV